MADRLLVELGADGQVAVGPWLESDLPQAGERTPLTWPLDADALEDLRWYLEDYLRAPFGVYGERGPEVEERLARWGEAIFSAVFGGGAARDAYIKVLSRGGPVEMVFRSQSPSLLGLPWELMRDPGRPTPLALDLALSRSLPTAESTQTVPVPGGRLRVLMAISRPAGGQDVGYRMIARPLLERLEAVRGQVDLVVLRPPTLQALYEVLTAAAEEGKPFQVVHFDGHGTLTPRRPTADRSATFHEAQAEAVLVFERPGGGPDQVSASKVAQVLKAGQVPLVVLNACQSGAVGKELEAAVATRLLQEGTASVVAMAYTVYAVAAAEFMAAFYERLFAGDTVGAAVTAGRNRLFQASLRPSPKGDMPLADWLVPVHYLRRDVSFPQARTSRRAGVLSLDEAMDQRRRRAVTQDSGELDPTGAFVGRDALFFELEAATRQRVVVLHGPGGTGKTELAKAFGRWRRDTDGVERPGWVFWHSFEPGVASFGLDGVIAEIGLAVFGSEFAHLDPAERREVVENLLVEHRLLLIWDNFETVASMPDLAAAASPLDHAGRQELKDFLARVAARGRSAVIITSRAREDWLGAIRHITVGGLAAHEAAEYAGVILADHPAAWVRRAQRAFADLMAWLDGHPLSMKLILPHLDRTDPAVLLHALRGASPLPSRTGDHGERTDSLTASLGYSYHHLTSPTRRLLAAVTLFHRFADSLVLAGFAEQPDVPQRFAGTVQERWTQALDEAAQVGLLTRLSPGIYRIHPALPAYLAHQWATEEPDGYTAAREAATRALTTTFWDFGLILTDEVKSGNAGLALQTIGMHHRTIGSLLDFALARGLWEEAHSLSGCLHAYWNARGLNSEADTWADRIREATENPDGSPPRPDTLAGQLWMNVTSHQVNRQIDGGQLDEAEDTLQRMAAVPETSSHQDSLAVIHHELGNIACKRGRLDAAEEWYAKALAIQQTLGSQQGIAMEAYQLGWVALLRGKLDEAERLYHQALTILTKAGNQPRVALTYHQLGAVAQTRGQLDEAENWYTKGLKLNEHLGDQDATAASYVQLGAVARERDRLDEAEDLYTRALTLWEKLGNQPRIAISYTQFGEMSRDRGRLDEAERWYTQALAIEECLGDRPGMARDYKLLGEIAAKRGQLDEAERWYTQALAIEETLGGRPDQADIYDGLARIAAKRGQLDEAEQWYTRAYAIREHLSDRPGTDMTPYRLGVMTQEQGRLGEADQWFAKALAMRERLGDRLGMAECYLHLGEVAQALGRLDDAEEQFTKALAIETELRCPLGVAASCHRLGTIAKERGQLDDAERRYRQAMGIWESEGKQVGVAASYHQLGMIAEERGQLDDAEGLYLQSLAIEEDLGNWPGMKDSYNQLTAFAIGRGRLEEAEDWCRKALAVSQETGDQKTQALCFAQIGILANQRKEPAQALEWMVRCVTVFGEFPHPATEPGPALLAQLTALLGTGVLETAWQAVVGRPVPQAVHDYVAAAVRAGGDSKEAQ